MQLASPCPASSAWSPYSSPVMSTDVPEHDVARPDPNRSSYSDSLTARLLKVTITSVGEAPLCSIAYNVCAEKNSHQCIHAVFKQNCSDARLLFRIEELLSSLLLLGHDAAYVGPRHMTTVQHKSVSYGTEYAPFQEMIGRLSQSRCLVFVAWSLYHSEYLHAFLEFHVLGPLNPCHHPDPK
eukprot:4596290-Pleurochrysis_carterae.AAC.1